ncbi:MAG: 50S ribosomal protein L11 [Candidatus Nanoarchaeia archaeon]
MIIKLLIEGGEMKPGPAIAQQLGPLGINIGKVISSINEATKEFKGTQVPVELNVNEKTKEFTIKTSSPPTAELIKKELGLEKGTASNKKIKVGNASIEDIIKITKIKYPNMLEKSLKSAVQSVVGTAVSVGILVENEDPKDIVKKIQEGKFDKEINSELTETSSEKRKSLNEYFNNIKNAQEARLKQEQKAAEEAAAAAAAAQAAQAAPAPGAAPAAPGTQAPAAKAADAKAPKADAKAPAKKA